jgi:hypothetical protein
MTHPEFLELGLFSIIFIKKRSKNIFRPLFDAIILDFIQLKTQSLRLELNKNFT